MSTSRIESRKSLSGSDPVFSQSHTPAYTRSYDPIDYNHNHPADYNHHHQADFAEPSPGLTQPPPTYPPVNMHSSKPSEGYNQGYPAREGLTPSAPRKESTMKRWCSFMSNKWAAMFFGVTVLQAIICLCFESYVFARFQSSIGPNLPSDLPPQTRRQIEANMKTIPTFLTLFIFGFLYEFVIVWDALRAKNTIQVIGVCFANLALVIYTAIQVDQMKWALDELFLTGQVKDVVSADIVFEWLRPSLIVIPCIIGLVTVLMSFITWKLYQEFAWDILKIIGADYRMKKRFLHYQIYIALLKFDFFFFLGFIIQLVVIVTDTQDVEFALTIVTIPITILILLAAAFFTRRENKWGMGGIFILYIGGLTYFIYKLARIHSTDPKWQEYYKTVRRSLTAFAAITIFFILLTMANCIMCVLNFNKGLKQHLLSKKKKKKNVESQDPNDVNLDDVKPQNNRMTID